MKRMLTAILLAMTLTMGMAQEPLYVGGDISVLQSYEDHSVGYYDQQGRRIGNVLQYLKSEAVSWNALRVRLFVNPQRKGPEGETDAQVCQDLDYVVRLCKRIKAAGFSLLLDFHYSDTWADPANQWIPAEWAPLTEEQLQAKVEDYTRACLQRLVEEEAAPDFIQTGNEISYGMLWSATVDRTSWENRCYADSPDACWTRFETLLQRATKACREVCPQAKIVLHTERAGDPDALKLFYQRLNDVDYDIIGLSYYPFWHNSLTVLGESLDMLATKFPAKPVHIVETAYYYQYASGIDYDFSETWPYTPEGQETYANDLTTELKKHGNVKGLYWWFPEENGNGPDNSVLTGWVNRGLWDNATHRALPALYVLKDFLDGSTAVASYTYHSNNSTAVAHDLQGRPCPSARKGIRIGQRNAAGRKVLVGTEQ